MSNPDRVQDDDIEAFCRALCRKYHRGEFSTPGNFIPDAFALEMLRECVRIVREQDLRLFSETVHAMFLHDLIRQRVEEVLRDSSLDASLVTREKED